MTRRGLTSLAAASLLALAAGANRASGAEIAVTGQAGYFGMAASRSAKAVFGSANAISFGGSLRATVWRGAFAEVGVRTFSKSGERVFVADASAPVQKLGFPLTMRTTPVFLGVGYRFRNKQTIVPYISAGLDIALYRERSSVAGQSYDVDQTKTGFFGAGGVEVGRGLFRFGAEVGYSTVPNTLGVGGVSKIYGEKDLGGFHAIGRIGLAFGL